MTSCFLFQVLLFGFCTIFTTEAQVCVCPRVESFYARPTYAVAQSPIAHHGCLGTTGFDGEWYTVNADGRVKIGFIFKK